MRVQILKLSEYDHHELFLFFQKIRNVILNFVSLCREKG